MPTVGARRYPGDSPAGIVGPGQRDLPLDLGATQMKTSFLAAMVVAAIALAACSAAPTASPKPPKPTLTEREKYLLAGVRRGAIDCEPVRDELPPNSGAGIECASD